MAVVYIPTLLRSFTGGTDRVEIEGSSVRQVIDNLELRWPGIRDRLIEGGKLRPNISVSVDGEIGTLGLREVVQPSSEIHFVTAIAGG